MPKIDKKISLYLSNNKYSNRGLEFQNVPSIFFFINNVDFTPEVTLRIIQPIGTSITFIKEFL